MDKRPMRPAFLIVVALLIGLSGLYLIYSVVSPTTKNQDRSTSIAQQPPIQSEPQPMNWVLSKDLFTTRNDASLAVHLLEIEGKHSVIIYSVIAPQVRAANMRASLVETGKGEYAERAPNHLAQFGDLQFIASSFDPPKTKGSELHLNLRAPQLVEGLDIQVTKKLEGPNSGRPPLEGDSDVFARAEQIEQGGYRITFNGFFLNTQDLQADLQNAQPRTQEEDLKQAQGGSSSPGALPTQMPAPMSNLTVELAGGKTVRSDATFRIENLQTKAVKFLYVVILDDGEVRARVIE